MEMINLRADRWLEMSDWVKGFIFGESRHGGVRLGRLLKEAKMWEYDPKAVKEEVKRLLSRGTIEKLKGRLVSVVPIYASDAHVLTGRLQRIAKKTEDHRLATELYFISSLIFAAHASEREG
jgi:hypothetical protein